MPESEAAALRRELLAREGTSSILRPDLCFIPKETFQKVVSYLGRQMRGEIEAQEQPPVIDETGGAICSTRCEGSTD